MKKWIKQLSMKRLLLNESCRRKYRIIKQLHDAGVPMILRTDASGKYMVAGFSVLGEMELLKKKKLSNDEILKMTTSNFANFFNENYGILEVGKDADFIILNSNPLKDLQTLKNIQDIYFNQHLINKKALDTIRDSILKTIHK